MAWLLFWLCCFGMPLLTQAILFGAVYNYFVNESYYTSNLSDFKLTTPLIRKWALPTTMTTKIENNTKRFKKKTEVTTVSSSTTPTMPVTNPTDNRTSDGVNDLDPKTYRMYYDELAYEVENLSSQLYSALAAQKSPNSSCHAHAYYLHSQASHDDDQAIKMVDAMAKLPSAALTGNLFWAGSFSECIQTAVDTNTSGLDDRFTGMYCVADVQRHGKLATAMYELSPPVVVYILRDASLKLGVCIPSSCSPEEVEDALKTIVTDRHELIVAVDEDYCQTDFYTGYHLGFFLVVVLVSLWCGCVLLSTLWDLSNGSNHQPKDIIEDTLEETDEPLLESPQDSNPRRRLSSDPPPSFLDKLKTITGAK